MTSQFDLLANERGLKRSTAFQGGSRANRTALQESVKRLLMIVTYGLKCGELSALLNPNGSWLKTCGAYCQVNMDGSLEEYSGILPTWGTLSHGELRAQPQLEPYISEKEWRLLPTPIASDAEGGAGGGRVRNGFREFCACDCERCSRWPETALCPIYAIQNPEAAPEYIRKSYGLPDWVDRVKAIGNAVSPPQFYPVFKAIAEIMEESNDADIQR